MTVICLGPVCIPIYALLPALFLLLKKLWDKCFGRKGAPTRASSSAADGEVSQPVRSKERKSLVPEGDGKVQIPADDDEAEAQLTAAADRIVLASKFGRPCPAELYVGDEAFVMFTASWCKPCTALKPVFAELAAAHKRAAFVMVDSQACQDSAADRFRVSLLPTFVCLDRGNEVSRESGPDADGLREWVQRNLTPQ